MKSTAIFRLESLLQTKKLDGTLVGSRLDLRARVVSSGLADLDTVLGGGWRRGEVSEVVGRPSSGRTRVLWQTMAAATARGDVVGLVDAVDRFDPRAAAGTGLDLDRVLWVRGPMLTVELARSAMIARAVHQAVRAFDLIVRAGGFALVVLDLADIPARDLRTLPWTTWLRLAHANEGRDTVGLLVGAAPMGKSPRGATVHLETTSCWTGESRQSRRLTGLRVQFRTGVTAARAAVE